MPDVAAGISAAEQSATTAELPRRRCPPKCGTRHAIQAPAHLTPICMPRWRSGSLALFCHGSPTQFGGRHVKSPKCFFVLSFSRFGYTRRPGTIPIYRKTGLESKGISGKAVPARRGAKSNRVKSAATGEKWQRIAGNRHDLGNDLLAGVACRPVRSPRVNVLVRLVGKAV